MQEVRFDRLCRQGATPILHGMKNLNSNRYPTPEELYALEQQARRLRAAEVARLFRAGAAGVRNLFRVNVKGLRHA